METIHFWLLAAARTDAWVSILKCSTTRSWFKVDKSTAGRRSHVFFGTRNSWLLNPREDSLYGSLGQQGIDGLLEILAAVPGAERDAVMGKLRSMNKSQAHPFLDSAGGPAGPQQTLPLVGKACQASSHLQPINVGLPLEQWTLLWPSFAETVEDGSRIPCWRLHGGTKCLGW